MRTSLVLAVLALAAGLLAACGTPTGASVSGPRSHVRQELLRTARKAARANGAALVSAEAVRSHRDVAVRDLTGDGVAGNGAVWVVQIKGSHRFTCRVCSYPTPGVKPTRGRYIVEIVRATDFRLTDFNTQSGPADLSRLGHVVRL